MRINKPLLLICGIVTINDLLAQVDTLPEFPSMRECRPQVAFAIHQDSDSSFLFSYNVSNLPSAIQSINMFLVQIRTEGFSSDAPKDWYSSNIKREHIQAATWAPSDTGLNIRSGKLLNGFKIFSNALPSLVNFYAHGEVSLSPSEIEFRQGTNDIFYNSFIGKTVGPADPPTSFIHLAFLDTLLSYTRQSAELGWLGRERDNDCDNDERPEVGIVRNIELRLNKAKRQLERRDSVLARRELEKLVSKVERLWKRSQDDDKKDKRGRWEKRDKVVMTSEAYALLKYNTEYLIDRLPNRKPKKGYKDKD